jgi:hypothetical protein
MLSPRPPSLGTPRFVLFPSKPGAAAGLEPWGGAPRGFGIAVRSFARVGAESSEQIGTGGPCSSEGQRTGRTLRADVSAFLLVVCATFHKVWKRVLEWDGSQASDPSPGAG